MTRAAVQWMAPRPLWEALRGRSDRVAARRPAILRFATDQFIEEAQAILAGTAGPLSGCVARPETWSAPAAGLDPPPSAGDRPLTLYQPVHQRFYLLSAALTCRLPGLPDHALARGEQVGFVVRWVAPVSDADDLAVATQRREYAWIGDTDGRWVAVSGSDALMPGEQRLPLFPMIYAENGQRRRMFAGLIPVSRRQKYISGRGEPAGQVSSGEPDALDDPRVVEFQRRVIDPWGDLLDWFQTRLDSAQLALPATIISIEQSCALILLDFAMFLDSALPALWNAIITGPPPAAGPLRALYDALSISVTDHRPGGGQLALRAAIADVFSHADALEAATLGETGPAELPAGCPRIRLTDEPVASALMVREANGRRRLLNLLAAAVPADPPAATARQPERSPADPRGDAWFVLYCFYVKPQCGPGAPPVLSRSTEPFQMASYFDADAPARSLQVALPIDTTPAGLRKFDKNVAFMISDELGKQMRRVKGLRSLEEGDLNAPGLSLGMICSLSIPIITICAFILLMIIVQLLNIVFFWLPFFKICFPLPQLRAKGGG